MKDVIVILGNGFLGNSIYRSLLNEGHRVAIYSKKYLNYTDYDTLSTWLCRRRGIIINASGYTGVPNVDAAEDNKELCWKLNVEVPATIAAAVANTNYFWRMIHISSGCIYNGYDKDYSEEDVPNFGLYNPESSFYSKTKHAAETILNNFPVYSLRLRIPFDGSLSRRNYLYKLMKYDNLINCLNSVTCINDFCKFISNFILRNEKLPYGPYNVVNPGVIDAVEIIELLRAHGVSNPKHKFIHINELQTKAKRSNVILDSSKLEELELLLPPVGLSIRSCIKEFAENWRLEND